MASDAIPLTVHKSSLSVVYEWLATVDHKKIGIMYIVYALLFLVVMGIEAILMRLQLSHANATFLSPQVFNRLFTLHGTTAVSYTHLPAWEQTDENWQRNIAVNLTGVFNCCRAVVPHMRGRGYGRIVNIASIAGKEGNPNMSPYSATKGAVIAFTKSLGKELATDGICVNAVAPAVVQTEILDQLTPAQVSYMTDRIPMKRTGKPEEIAAVVHFLSSPDCSFVTAQCYDASGGRATY